MEVVLIWFGRFRLMLLVLLLVILVVVVLVLIVVCFWCLEMWRLCMEEKWPNGVRKGKVLFCVVSVLLWLCMCCLCCCCDRDG